MKKEDIIKIVKDTFSISDEAALTLLEKVVNSKTAKIELAEKILIELLANRDASDTLDWETGGANANNQALIDLSITLAEYFYQTVNRRKL